jgi:hypothetical protein
MIGQYVAGAMVKWLRELHRYNRRRDRRSILPI